MKHVILFIAAAVTISGFSACNRNYTCQCTNNVTGQVLIGNVMARSASIARENCYISDTAARQYYTCGIK